MTSICELEINTSPLLVCSAQLTLTVSVLLHSSPPTELLGEQEVSAAPSFSKIRFVAAAGYSRCLLTKVKSFEGCIWWTGVSFMQCPFPLLLQMISHCPPVYPALEAGNCVSVQLWAQGQFRAKRLLSICKSTCRSWKHCHGNNLIMAGVSRGKVSNFLKLVLLTGTISLWPKLVLDYSLFSLWSPAGSEWADGQVSNYSAPVSYPLDLVRGYSGEQFHSPGCFFIPNCNPTFHMWLRMKQGLAPGTEDGLSASAERFALLMVTSLTERTAKWPNCGLCHDQRPQPLATRNFEQEG